MPSGPDRFAGFARQARRMVRAWPAVAAAAPIPAAVLKLIPAYQAQRPLLAGLGTAFNFLLFASVFYNRHALAKGAFARRGRAGVKTLLALLPIAAIAASLACLLGYLGLLDRSLGTLAEYGVSDPTAMILKNTEWGEIPFAVRLAALFIGFFGFAELAFIWVALREYMQDVLGYRERDLGGARKRP